MTAPTHVLPARNPWFASPWGAKFHGWAFAATSLGLSHRDRARSRPGHMSSLPYASSPPPSVDLQATAQRAVPALKDFKVFGVGTRVRLHKVKLVLECLLPRSVQFCAATKKANGGERKVSAVGSQKENGLSRGLMLCDD